jgi:hypothetical protein
LIFDLSEIEKLNPFLKDVDLFDQSDSEGFFTNLVDLCRLDQLALVESIIDTDPSPALAPKVSQEVLIIRNPDLEMLRR